MILKNESTVNNGIACKNCGATSVVKFGTYKGSQRYFCKVCNRKFKGDNTPFHMKTAADIISFVIDEYFKGVRVRHIRRLLKQHYSCYPAKPVVYRWIRKYTGLAQRYFNKYQPEVGNVWIAGIVTLDLDGQRKVWIHDIKDAETKFLLSSRVVLSGDVSEFRVTLYEACCRAGKLPAEIITDFDSLDTIGSLEDPCFVITPLRHSDDDTLMERFYGILENDIKVIRSFRVPNMVMRFNSGWTIYYNYFKPNLYLNGRIPAEAARIKYDVKSWDDFLHRLNPLTIA